MVMTMPLRYGEWGWGTVRFCRNIHRGSNARSVTEIRRPVYRVDFGTPCFHTRLVAYGNTKTAPFAAGKSRFTAPCASRKLRVSPKEIVTIDAPGAMRTVLSRCGPM